MARPIVQSLRALTLALCALLPAPAAHAADDRSLPSVAAEMAVYRDNLTSLSSYELYVEVLKTEYLRRRSDPSSILPADPSVKLGNLQRQPPVPQYVVASSPKSEHYLTLRQLLSGRNFRIDCLSVRDVRNEPGKLAKAWNSTLLQVYNGPRKDGKISATATDPNLMGGDLFPFSVCFQTAFGDYSYSDFVRDRSATLELLPNSIVKIDAPPALGAVNAGTYGVRMYLDTRKNHMPSIIEIYTKAQALVCEHIRIENGLKEVRPGLWLPTTSRISFFITAPGSSVFGKEYARFDVSVDMNKSQFNEPIEDDLFSLEFPVGTLVRDDTRSAIYVVGSEDQDSTLLELVRQGRISAGELAKPSPPITKRSGLLIWGNAVLITLIVVGTVIRRRMQASRRSESHGIGVPLPE